MHQVFPASVVQRRLELLTGETLELRLVHSVDEYRQCEALQMKIWGADDIGKVPTLDLITAQENGGLVIGAFNQEQRLVGFVYSFPGLTPTRWLKQCSVIMGIDPAYQTYGIGYHLKLVQSEAVRAQGIDLITWTFDPLVSRNAHLNLTKLGAISKKYLTNLYGTGHGLNAGLETDRLLVEWHLAEEEPLLHKVVGAVELEGTLVNEVVMDATLGLPMNRSWKSDLEEETLLIQIPDDIQMIKAQNLELACKWRFDTRKMFQHYLDRGYVIEGFQSLKSAMSTLPCYVLRRGLVL
ncbi:GNAT family N-acetyltransferase [Tumebacillus permanentifrigoris]|uniref:GNAT family N-acetyltransferase n=1 Tax=Tumebacillus permanentifrigoris TaxID=378543 RepID=UPI00147372CF|nr:GNAT family N-acetyltransferase [Tumebacillus permanentifrigoris]